MNVELHPILDQATSPNPGLWYVLSALGESPSERVGHTCTYIPGPSGQGGHVYVVGGANPEGSFGEVYILDLDTFSWDTVATSMKPRYEHAAFIPESHPRHIYVFGGADQNGNHNDVQAFDIAARTWSVVAHSGNPPSPRTYHTTSAVGDKLYVYSGGHLGADPVTDRQVHVFDAATSAWSLLSTRGDPPKPRHGHVMVAVGRKLFLHGGMSGNTFYDDLHILDLDTNMWRDVKQKKGRPPARAAHVGVVIGTDIYICGGMNRDGALDDTYKLDTLNSRWSRVELDGPAPSCRLDFSGCAVWLQVPVGSGDAAELLASGRQAKEVIDGQRLGSAGSVRSAASGGSAGSQHSIVAPGGTTEPRENSPHVTPDHSPSHKSPTSTNVVAEEAGPHEESLSRPRQYRTVQAFLILGGMDTEGEIFDDCLVMVKEN